ncbi:MAG TPA: response regulator, partial [Blastocatellia bacterium]|nr:response regulator [Blastocatellia bacterium]
MIRALIVDDEPLSRERIRTLLRERRNVEVIGECRDGQEAVNAILAERPDLVFLDIQMPELDGFEVIKAIGNEFMPAIVFVTSFDEYAIRAFEVNAIDYLL